MHALTSYSLRLTLCTTSCNIRKLCSAHNEFMCFTWISEQTAIISLYSINWLVCVTETECVYCAVWIECIKFRLFLVYKILLANLAGPSGRAVEVLGLRLLACWYCGSNPAGGMDVCLLWVLCVASLRLADHSSSGVLRIVVRRCVIAEAP